MQIVLTFLKSETVWPLSSRLLTSATIKTLSNKQIYDDLSDFPVPKIVLEAPGTDFTPVWRSLHSSFVDRDEANIMFLLIHNKLPVNERLFRIGIKNDPYCSECPAAIIADIEHWFCQCVKTRDAWEWFRQRLLLLDRKGGMMCSNSQLLSLFIPVSKFKWDMVWLISSYVHFA